MTRRLVVVGFALLALCFCDIAAQAAGGERKSTLTPTSKVREVVSASEIILKDDRHIQLAGVNVPSGMVVTAKARLDDVLLPRLVILDPVQPGSTSCVVYVWGEVDLQRKDFLPVEKRGFTDVHVGFMNVQKGRALNVNALLIREGYAITDTNAPREIVAAFMELQDLAKREKRGLWTSGD